jgi:hypothetical protein
VGAGGEGEVGESGTVRSEKVGRKHLFERKVLLVIWE